MLVVGLAVLSHFFLDGAVHVAGLPLLGESSPNFGLGLSKTVPLELGIETLMALIGITLYWKASGSGRSGSARYGMTIFVALFTALTWSRLAFSVPLKPQQLNIFWIVLPLLLSAMAYGLDYGRAHAMNFGEAGVPNP